MKRVLKIVGVVFGVLLALVGAVLAFVLMTSRPTTGPRIQAHAQPRPALLVVDIQEDFTGPNAIKPYRDGERLVQAANRLIEHAREKGMLMAYVINVVDHPIMKVLAGGTNAPGGGRSGSRLRPYRTAPPRLRGGRSVTLVGRLSGWIDLSPPIDGKQLA